jgi:hypothetical protein
VALPGRHDRLEVVPLPSGDSAPDDERERDPSSRRRTSRRRAKKAAW